MHFAWPHKHEQSADRKAIDRSMINFPQDILVPQSPVACTYFPVKNYSAVAHSRINNSGKNSKRAGPMESEPRRGAIRIKLSVISDISQVVHQTTPILHERLAFYPACACPSPPPRPTNPPSFGERLPTTKRHGGLWWVISLCLQGSVSYI